MVASGSDRETMWQVPPLSARATPLSAASRKESVSQLHEGHGIHCAAPVVLESGVPLIRQ